MGQRGEQDFPFVIMPTPYTLIINRSVTQATTRYAVTTRRPYLFTPWSSVVSYRSVYSHIRKMYVTAWSGGGFAVFDTSTEDAPWPMVDIGPALTSGTTQAMCFLDNDTKLLWTGQTSANLARVFDVETWNQVKGFNTPENRIMYQAEKVPGTNLFVAGFNGTVNGCPIAFYRQDTVEIEDIGVNFTYSNNSCHRVVPSPDGTKVACNFTTTNAFCVVDIATNTITVPTWSPSLGQASQTDWSPDGKYFVVAQSSGDARIFETDTWTQVASQGQTGGYYSGAAFSPCGRYLVLVGYTYPQIVICNVGEWEFEPFTTQMVADGNATNNNVFFIPPDEFTTIAGTVRDENNSPAQRTVKAYRRSTGELMLQTESDPTTGEYSMIVENTYPYDVVFKAPDDAGLNDIIKARITPE